MSFLMLHRVGKKAQFPAHDNAWIQFVLTLTKFCLTFDFLRRIIRHNKGYDGEKDILTQHVRRRFPGFRDKVPANRDTAGGASRC